MILNFLDWLTHQSRRDDDVGRLSLNLLLADDPRPSTHSGVRFYLERQNAHPMWIAAYWQATEEFDLYRQKKRPLRPPKQPKQHKQIIRLPAPSYGSLRHAGMVYLIQAEGTTRIKIGRSMSTTLRFESLRTASPFPLRLLRTIASENCVKLEGRLHKRYAKYRQHREWFDLPPEVLRDLLQEHFD